MPIDYSRAIGVSSLLVQIRSKAYDPSEFGSISGAFVRRTFVVILTVVALIPIFLLVFKPLTTHRLKLIAYFSEANRLRAGAPVTLAGVEIGHVQSVRVRTDLRETPAEVVMLIQNPYEIKIPRDAVVDLRSAGVLGETFANIDITTAVGPPVQNGGTLSTRAIEEVTAPQLIEKLSEILKHRDCLGDENDRVSSHVPQGPKQGRPR